VVLRGFLAQFCEIRACSTVSRLNWHLFEFSKCTVRLYKLGVASSIRLFDVLR
jgi:hypothetical protein